VVFVPCLGEAAMTSRSAVRWGTLGFAGLVLALAGCSRPAVVAVPEGVADVTPDRNPAPAGRGNGDKEEEPGGLFPFPRDVGGALLAKVLPPAPAGASEERATRPRPRPAPRSLEVRSDPLPPPNAAGVVPALPAQGKKPALLPRLVSEEALVGASERVALPEETVLPAWDRPRVPSPDVNEPLALPILAQAVPDREPLEDPTGDASTAAALAAPLPPRVIPAPFLRLSIPDPYELRRPLTLLAPPEAADPHTSTPQTPKP
jgi:hypothetical protein